MRLPSTKALRAFEAAARLGSIRAAADFLAVTPSALSRRIQSLEEELGQSLFERDPRGLLLTEAGRQYAQRLQAIFQSLADATDAARVQAPRRVRILAPGLYAHYLMPGLKHFESKYPNVRIALDVFPGALGSDPRIDEADIVILFGDGKWEGWDTHFLTPGGYGVPVCAPDYLPNGMVEDPRELARYTWIQTPHFSNVWVRWCEAAGCPGLQPKNWFEVNNGLMAREAARNGIGIWMGGGTPNRPMDAYFASGNLVLAHSVHVLLRNFGFYLAWRPHALANPAVQAFRDWLTAGGSRADADAAR
jgi:LysR family glycine cleavage system transcriptional activator